ncbi:MAG: beta-ketoacyl-ACP synthase II [Deltaproteobacteria bacterium]|nr:MAG: beta-ketoacyl-ACP synthase II [Deltaproteobacteria bacterium]
MRSRAPRRVVVTGLGCFTPLGDDVEATFAGAVEGRSGVREIDRFDASQQAVRFAGLASERPELPDLPAKEVRRMDRFLRMALVAAREAIADSGLEVTDANRHRIGVAIGSGIGGLSTLEDAYRTLFDRGPRRLTPFVIPMVISNIASGYVSILYGFHGPNLCHVSACTTGVHAIGEAARSIAWGDADVLLAGGAEAPVSALGVGGFAAMRALSTRNDEPQRASRPFDLDRDGFVLGEGAGVLVLEALDSALARGAPIRAELLGYGTSADAAHITLPAGDGRGARQCMENALHDAGLEPSDIEYVNAHGTSTPAGDVVEAAAIRAVFGLHAERLPVSSTKSTMGHLLGAAGAVEALLCVRALETGRLPPTINLDRPDPECELDHVANKARYVEIRTALSNSFGFGGTNASLILGRYER